MRTNKMKKNIDLKLLDESGKVMHSEGFRIGNIDFQRNFHKYFYDTIRDYAEKVETLFHLQNYQIVMEVKQTQ